ncbi:Gfo/Idh/MocA family protein [Rhizobium rhizogenes]|uniref:Gfo/Idh/MocA family protein n=1 Tax=Rhizobium rhizogenes TaxID=359 RepID=UPI001573282D|nr:Gfo/Idh/MocA family oxidoreductase [Rhizobium rhizogenes]NTF44276.1 Gfo/Idh/MocA family oxidoreductase [Rhizobium rhizogenes]
MRLRVGLVGLGEVAQLMHIPTLHKLQEQFELTAVHDVSPSVLARVADHWKIAKRYDTAAALFADSEIDAVLILSPDQHHGEQARAAIAAGKHVFIEKPACLTAADLETLVAAEVASDRVVMVGYMRRFAPAFMAAKQELASFGPISYVRVRDVICEGPWFFNQTDKVVTPNGDIPAALIDESRALRKAMMDAMCGADAPAIVRRGYEVMTGLCSHSLSAMRDLLGGSPKRVLGAQLSQNGEQLTAMFDYGDFTAIYECLIDDIARFDAGIEVFSKTKRLNFRYNTPYLRNLPMTLEVQESTGDSNLVRTLGPFHKDAFQIELEAFHASIANGAPNRTPPSDSREDIELFSKILAVAKSTLAE